MLWWILIASLSSFKISYCKHPPVEYSTHFFEQRVDHFSYSNNDYFKQRYLVSDRYWNTSGGPIFMYIGNESPVTSYAEKTGIMWELGPKFHALIVFAEHRYYGESLPYGNESLSNTRNKGYLTTEQALADFASLIYHIKNTYPNAGNSKVIAFGGSYGGMLSTWIRLKYPFLVNGAIAASAPILMFSDLTPCSTFDGIATKNFRRSSPECAASVRRSWRAIKNLATTEDGVQWLASNSKSCFEFHGQDIDQLINWLKVTWETLAMENYPYPAGFDDPLPANPVDEACQYLKNPSDPEKVLLSNIFKAASVLRNSSGTLECNNFPTAAVEASKPGAWSYQTCTEMVMPDCTNGITDMFEPKDWDINSYSDDCMKQHNVRPDPEKNLVMFGGKDITASSNILFSNGQLDPWAAGSVLEDLSPTLVSCLMEDAAHHLDLRYSNAEDPISVVLGRQMEQNWITEWLRN